MARKQADADGNGGLSSRRAIANHVATNVQGKTTLEVLAAEVDKRVVAAGGEAKPGMSKAILRRALETMEMMGVVKLTKPTDVVIERLKK